MLVDKMFKVSVFGDFENIEPTPDDMSFLVEAFSTQGLLPSLTQEIVIKDNNPPTPIQRMSVISRDNVQQINIGTNRIDFSYKYDYDITLSDDDVSLMLKNIISSFEKLFCKYDIDASRLALNANTFVIDVSNEDVLRILNKYTNPISLFNQDLGEWSTRLHTTKEINLADNKVKINLIANISKVQLVKVQNEQPTNTIGFSINIDINTTVDTKKRFDINDLSDFLSKAIEYRSSIVSEAVI